MEKDIDQMVTGGMKPVYFEVEHVAQPGKGVPVGGIECSKSPLNTVPSQPGLDIIVLHNVWVIVPVYKTECNDFEIQG